MRAVPDRVQTLASSRRTENAPQIEVLRRNYFQRLIPIRLRHESHTIKVQQAGILGAMFGATSPKAGARLLLRRLEHGTNVRIDGPVSIG